MAKKLKARIRPLLKNRFVSKHKLLIIHALIFFGAFFFFMLGIGRVDYPVFDEVRYVVDGREFVNHGVNFNWTSPPLGRMLIGVGISLFGYEPWGWRIMSVIFGALSLNAMFSLGLIFFTSEWVALEIVALCFLNQILFVQSRIGMLDIFMFSLMAWGLVFFFKNRQNPHPRNLVLAGVFFGLAMAAKWFAIVPALFCYVLYFIEKKKEKKRGSFKLSKLYWIAAPAVAYFGIYAFILGMGHPKYATPLSAPSATSSGSVYGVLDLIPLQWEMLKTQIAYGKPDHPLASSWYSWPLSWGKFWYRNTVTEVNGTKYFSGILLFGNPLVLWLGFLSVGVAIYAWIKKKNQTAKIISLLYLVLFLSWIIIPRKTMYIFYYFPAAMMLSLSLVFAFQYFKVPVRTRLSFLVACAIIFCYFYPLLSFVSVPLESGLYKYPLAFWNAQVP